MGYGGWAPVSLISACGSIGLALACGPAVPADSEATGESATATTAVTDSLPPLTSTSLPMTGAPDSAAPVTTIDEPVLDVHGGGITGIPPEDPCFEGWEVEALNPRVVFVVDLSSSMVTQTVDHDGNPASPETTRWHAVRAGLQRSLWAWDDSHELGLSAFPWSASAPPDPSACFAGLLALEPAPGAAATLLGALPPADDLTLSGATPTREAIDQARALLSSYPFTRRRYMVLLTDGAPNCDPLLEPPALFDEVDDGAAQEIASAANFGFQTAVVALDVPDAPSGGMDGDPLTNPRQVLDGLAAAGGITSAALPVSSVSELVDALEMLRVMMDRPRLQVPDPLLSFGWYEVEIGGVVYEEVRDCESEDGFAFVDMGEAPGRWDTLELCGEALGALAVYRAATIYPICVFPE